MITPPQNQADSSPVRAAFQRCVVLVCSIYLLYTVTISDYGFLLAVLSDMRVPEARAEWIELKLSVLTLSFLAISVFYFVLVIRRKISWGELIAVCVICFHVWLQLVMMNISPIN